MKSKFGFAYLTILVICILLFLLNIYLVFQSITVNRQLKVTESDYATVNNIRYGLLNENVWKAQIAAILSQEIEKTLQPGNLKPKITQAIRNTIETEMDRILPDFDLLVISKADILQMVHESKLSVKIVNSFSDLTIDIVDEMEIEKALFVGLTRAFGEIKFTEEKIQEIVNRYECRDADECNDLLYKEILLAQEKEKEFLFLSLLCTIGIVVFCFLLTKHFSKPAYLLLIITSVTLLVPGLTMPFINLDARIAHLEFTLFDQVISFDNQVVLFQSKSILEIVTSLLSHHDPMVIGVGALILLFSLVTPILKLTSSLLIQMEVIKSEKFTGFIHALGKWSMADVFTVALFMAYLGMNGLVNSNLNQLDQNSADILINTANYTHFKPGLVYFVGYTMLGILSTWSRFTKQISIRGA